MLQLRTDYVEEAEQVLKSTAPTFHKNTEDGTSFRIYKVGTVEVRTTQEYDGTEVVGAVFSVRTQAPQLPRGAVRCAAGREKISKATEYVQKVGADDVKYYVVLETE